MTSTMASTTALDPTSLPQPVIVDPVLGPTAKKAPVLSQKPHITDLPITASNWYKHVNWLYVLSFSAEKTLLRC